MQSRHKRTRKSTLLPQTPHSDDNEGRRLYDELRTFEATASRLNSNEYLSQSLLLWYRLLQHIFDDRRHYSCKDFRSWYNRLEQTIDDDKFQFCRKNENYAKCGVLYGQSYFSLYNKVK